MPWFYLKVKLLPKGTPQQLIKNTRAIEAYFGEGFQILNSVKNQVNIKNTIKPFNGKIFVSSDKSISIRCILLSSIAVGKSKILIYSILKM